MQESLYVTGIVLKQTPFGEYDRIVSLLTREKGKITAFARGARNRATGWRQRPTLLLLVPFASMRGEHLIPYPKRISRIFSGTFDRLYWSLLWHVLCGSGGLLLQRK